MDAILNAGIALIAWLQGVGPWVAGPMQFFSFFGTETFVLILIPLIYWCVDTGFAVQIGLIVLFSGGINEALKMVFHAPRPYWYSSRVVAYAAETSFGIPSGHSLTAMVTFGTAAVHLKRTWAWLLAIFMIFMIGLSRILLGVHFPTDVLAGWALGALFLWAFTTWWKPISAWVGSKSLLQQIGLSFSLSLILLLAGAAAYIPLESWSVPPEWMANAQQAGLTGLPAPVSLDSILTSAGALFGMLAGLAWMAAHGGYNPDGSLGQKTLRLLPGLIGIMVFYYLLGMVLPKGTALLPNALRYLRYALVGAWISAGGPWSFQKLNLAQSNRPS